MTIAAALMCTDGIVIAADTEETGYMKNDVHKFAYLRTQKWVGGVLGAGHASYADMFQQKIMDHLIANAAPGLVIDAPVPQPSQIEDYALTLFDRHMAPWGGFPEDERPEADLIIAIQPKEDQGFLAIWSGTSFVLPRPYAFVGIGSQMASRLYEHCRNAAPFWHTMREVAGIAIFILSQVKSVVRSCGGYTDLAMLGKDGHIYYMSEEAILEKEQKYRDWNKRVSADLAEAIMKDCKPKDDSEEKSPG